MTTFRPAQEVNHTVVTTPGWIGFLALCLGMFMAILDIQIVASSLPDIQLALHISADRLSWIQTAYLIAEIIAIPLTGWLTCLLSLRGLFVTAVLGFTLASFGCGMSNALDMLLLFRVVQGFCGGALIPVVFTSVFTMFPPRCHVLATTIGGAFAVLAPTIGPVLGGYMTENYSWHWLFFINIGPGILAAIIAAFTIRHGRPDWNLWSKLDYLSLVLAAVFLGSLELTLKEGPRHHWEGTSITALVILCPLAGYIAVRRCLSHSHPIVDLRCFASSRFNIGCFYSFVLGMGLYGSVYLLPLYLAFVRFHSPFEIGKTMIVMGAAQLAVAPFAAIAEKRINPLVLTTVGYGLFAAGLISNAFETYDTDFNGLFWPQVLRGSATMLCLLPATRLALAQQPDALIPNASGLFNLMRNLGGAIGIALVDTILEQRGPMHALELQERLMAGDPSAARIVGLPLARFHNVPLGKIDQATHDIVAPLVERAAVVLSFNDAWLVIGIVFVLAGAALPLILLFGIARSERRKSTTMHTL
jgi:DHA2 family multidrug resistance protein